MVVLPVLDPVLPELPIRYQNFRSSGNGTYLHALRNHDVIHLRWQASYYLHQQDRHEPLCGTYESNVDFRILPVSGIAGTAIGNILSVVPRDPIGIGGAAHQSWSANIFSTVGDMFPRTAIASITGIGGMAGGIGSMILQKVAGNLFVYASGTTMVDGKEVEMTKELLEQGAQFVHPAMTFMGFEGKPAGYFVIFCVCAVAYLIGWVIMKALVPKYKPIVLD